MSPTDGGFSASCLARRRAAIILLAPALDGCIGTEGDFALLRRLIASGARLNRVHERTTEFLADRQFQRRVGVLESALHSRPVMSGDEVALLLGDSVGSIGDRPIDRG